MSGGNLKSTFNKGLTIQKVCERLADDLRQAATDDKAIGSYGEVTHVAVTYTLGGGGPASLVTLIGTGQDGELEDIVEGYVSYFETSGHASVYLNRYDAQGIYDSLQKKDDDE